MRKILLLCFIALALVSTGCKSTMKYVSTDTFKEQLSLVEHDYSEIGFHFSGFDFETDNNLMVAGHTYYNMIPVSTILENDVKLKDTYTYRNDDGNVVRLKLSYELYPVTTNGVYGIKNIQICGCETDRSDLYEKLCGSNNLSRITNLNETEFEYLDIYKTIGSIIVPPAIAAICILMMRQYMSQKN